MGNAVPMGAVYPMCLFQTPNVLLPYTLSDPLKGGAHGYTSQTSAFLLSDDGVRGVRCASDIEVR